MEGDSYDHADARREAEREEEESEMTPDELNDKRWNALDARLFPDDLPELKPIRVCEPMERNFAANIITLLTMSAWMSSRDLEIKIRKQAELAILQIDRHNEGKPFDSVSVMAAYESGEGRLA